LHAITQPKGLQGLILASTLSDAQFYGESQQNLLQITLPPYMRERVQFLEANKAYDTEEYQMIVLQLTAFWTNRMAPTPQCVVVSSKLQFEVQRTLVIFFKKKNLSPHSGICDQHGYLRCNARGQ
jgi:hypothetical protein